MARLLVFILSLIFSNYGYSQRIPEIKEVPNRIPSEQKIVLDAKYALLTRLKASMLYEIKKFNAKCDKEIPVITENKLLLSECDKQERQLENAIKQLIDSINNFPPK